MGSSGPAGTRPRGLGQFTQMLPPAPGKNECVGQRVACVRAGFELSVNECACAHMCVRARVRRRGCRGGCRRGSFVEPLAGSEPACRLPWLVPRGHLALLHSPYISVSRRRPYFPRWPPRSSLQVLAAACRVAAPRPPGPRAGEGERRSADVGAQGREGGRAELERACCPLQLALGAAWSAALLPEAAAAPRPAPPCPLAAPSSPDCSVPGGGDGAGRPRAAGREKRALGAPAAGE